MRIIIVVVLFLLAGDGVQPMRWPHVYNTKIRRNRISGSSACVTLRGGTMNPSNPNDMVKVYISTRFGSNFLDKSMTMSLQRAETVGELKNQISKRFAGKPPVGLQKLFHGGRLLHDEEKLGDISQLAVLPIQLDMMTGTSSYERPMHTVEMVEAYTAACAQQAYLSTSIAHLLSPRGEAPVSDMAENVPEHAKYSEMITALNSSIYDSFGDSIAAAVAADSDAEAPSPDTLRTSMRHNSEGFHSVEEWVNARPRDAAIARLLDLNIASARKLLIRSAMCVVS